ncbi:MAG: GNAT family protein [SAR324 cluster bacterium]|nr:GNAT family protein [SAR324 cluster bacterium]
MAEFDPRSTTLTGKHARLEPLGLQHAQDLCEAGSSEDIWTYLPVPRPGNTREMESFVREALEMAATGTSVPFAIMDAQGGKAVGSTRYLDIQHAHRGLEVGWTWLGSAYQRTPINTECKLLLLQHAFEDHGAIRVQLKTDALNVRSQVAIERIGGKKEGVLRNHMIVQKGRVRDSVFFSILDTEWPEVKKNLLRHLGRMP